MNTLSFTSVEAFNKITSTIHFLYKGKNKPKLNEIRHEVAKDDGFNSIESYIKALSNLKNEEILFDIHTNIKYCDNDKRIYFSTRLNPDELIEINIDNSEEVAFLIFGEDVGAYAMDLYLDDKSLNIGDEAIYVFNCYFEIEDETKNVINEALEIHYNQFKSIQAYVFDDIFECMLSNIFVHELSDIIDDFKGDFSSISYDLDQEIDVSTHIDNETLIKGLPKSLYAYYSSENMSEMSEHQPDIVTEQTIIDTSRSAVESLITSYIKLIIEETYNNPTYAKNKYSAITIHNSNELDKFKSKLFAEYITL
jgi:hypothetical protein